MRCNDTHCTKVKQITDCSPSSLSDFRSKQDSQSSGKESNRSQPLNVALQGRRMRVNTLMSEQDSRSEQDSNQRGQSQIDFKSISLITQTLLHPTKITD
ncbi:hypothetical protein KIN20_013307 [Parelaphostrongylus tenuis]|uniref:Uncharacterized protein n=1 Tax=Parelaphostrongylus tenuis TaxID=148309 RepID=A0AAD5N1X3_PARTN|nr:hypothetical protein KIN20_013307 [Parelaphostrongylus tenuis]